MHVTSVVWINLHNGDATQIELYYVISVNFEATTKVNLFQLARM